MQEHFTDMRGMWSALSSSYTHAMYTRPKLAVKE